MTASEEGRWQCSSQWEWATRNTGDSGIGKWTVAVCFGARRQPARLSWSHSPQLHQDWLLLTSECLPYPSPHRARWPARTSSVFFLSSHFCFTIDTTDGSLISQLPCVPIWSAYIWKQIIWIHRFLEMVKGASIGYRGGLWSPPLPAPCLPRQYNFPRKTKRQTLTTLSHSRDDFCSIPLISK